MSTVYNSSDN